MQPRACDQFVYVIHIHYMGDDPRRKSVAFAFDVLTAEEVRNTELAQWVGRQRYHSSHVNATYDGKLHDLVERNKHEGIGPGKRSDDILMQTFIYETRATSSHGEVKSRWLPFYGWAHRTNYANFPEFKSPLAPLAYLKATVKAGTFVPIGNVSGAQYNAWGFRTSERGAMPAVNPLSSDRLP